MEYFAGIRALGEQNYLETGTCQEVEFHKWLNRATVLSIANNGKRMFVDFRQRPHTFEVSSDGKPHLITTEDISMVDPAASFLQSGD